MTSAHFLERWTPSGDGRLAGSFVPAAAVRRALDDLEAHGRIRHTYLGVVPTADPNSPMGVPLLVAVPGVAPEGDNPHAEWLDAVRARSYRLTVRNGPKERVKLSAVLPDSPAAKAGLEAGLVVMAIDDVDVPDLATFMRALARRRPGDEVRLSIEKWAKEVKVVLADREEASARLANAETLGLEVVDMGPDLARFLGLPPESKGVVVRGVRHGSPAHAAGLERGDLIVGGVRDGESSRP
jgi:S1-C subfamily serine protease